MTANLAAFFPSRTVTLYMVRLFLTRTFGILAGFVLVLMTLNVLGESSHILAHPENGDGAIWHFVALRGPELIAFMLPYSVLLGTLYTFFTMNQNSEIIALKASGLSAHQVLAPLILASLGVALVSFSFNDRIVSRASAALDRWQRADYRPVPRDSGERSDVWVRAGDDLVEVDRIAGRGDAARLGGVTLYQRNGGNLVGIVRAAYGMREGKGWAIWPATRFDVANGRMTTLGRIHIAEGVRPDQFTLATVDADGLSFGGLYRAIHDLRDAGRPTKQLEGDLWHKLSGPLSALLMPLLGAVAAFGVARSGKLYLRTVIGAGLGFAFFVADNFALAMGSLGAYPPILAAWAPFLLFLLIGEFVLIRSEE